MSYRVDDERDRSSAAVGDGSASRIKVIYIAGYGRSGTTLLSIALGQHPSVFGAGEIHELTRSAWRQNSFCACGATLQSCEFWKVVVQRWLGAFAGDFAEEYRGLQTKLENSFRPSPFKRGEEFDRFSDATQALFREIANASGRSVIVDSSKLPGRAEALSRMPEIDLYIVHLVRDGRGVAWSLKKSYQQDPKAGVQRELRPKPTLRTCLRWIFVNLAAETLAVTVGPDRYIRVRYEDFAEDPGALLARVGALTGIDFSSVTERLKARDGMSAQHQLAGSRLRMNAAITLSKDEGWRSQMPSRSRRLFTMASWPLLARYGYLKDRPAGRSSRVNSGVTAGPASRP